jgi:hypothetical protein
VLGGINGAITGSATTASYVEYSNVANKPTLVSGSEQVSFNGIIDKPTLVSGSEQITYSGLSGIPSGIVSSSTQITGYNIFATTGSNQFNGSQAITGSLTVTGQVVAQTLNVQQVTSSIVYSSGSNVFGNSLDNTQQFTGSLQVSGSSHYVLGNVGLGTTTPSASLHVTDGYVLIGIDKGVRFDTSGASGHPELSVDSTASLNFKNTAGSTNLTISNGGAATFASSVTATSLLATTWVGAQGTRISSAPSVQGVYLGNSGTTSGDFATIEMVGGTGGGSEIDFTVPSSDRRGRVGYDNTTNYMWFETNNGTEKMRITSDGDVFINNSSGVTLNGLTNKLSVSSTTYNLFDISRFSDNAFGPNFYLVKSRNGSIGGNTIVANGDNLGNITWVGANGTGFTDAASIKAEVDGTPGASNMQGRLVFSTTADGANNVTERMRITSGGRVQIGFGGTPNYTAYDLFVSRGDQFGAGIDVANGYARFRGDDDFVYIAKGGTDVITIGASNKVGIGDTNPNNIVDIYDATRNSNTVGVLAARTQGGGTFITGRTVPRDTSNQTVTIATMSTSGTNERIFIKVQVVNVSAVNNYGNVHVGYALWVGGGSSSVTTMTLDTGNSNIGNANVGTLSWSGNNLQYTTNGAGNYELNSITIWGSARDTGVIT